MAQRVKLRQRIPDEPEDVAYGRFQDDEHVQDVFQNPVRSLGKRARPLFAETRFSQRRRSHIEQLLDTQQSSIIVISVITLLSLFLRLYKISNPDQVVCVPRRVASARVILTCLPPIQLRRGPLRQIRRVLLAKVLLLRRASSLRETPLWTGGLVRGVRRQL